MFRRHQRHMAASLCPRHIVGNPRINCHTSSMKRDQLLIQCWSPRNMAVGTDLCKESNMMCKDLGVSSSMLESETKYAPGRLRRVNSVYTIGSTSHKDIARAATVKLCQDFMLAKHNTVWGSGVYKYHSFSRPNRIRSVEITSVLSRHSRTIQSSSLIDKSGPFLILLDCHSCY